MVRISICDGEHAADPYTSGFYVILMRISAVSSKNNTVRLYIIMVLLTYQLTVWLSDHTARLRRGGSGATLSAYAIL